MYIGNFIIKPQDTSGFVIYQTKIVDGDKYRKILV